MRVPRILSHLRTVPVLMGAAALVACAVANANGPQGETSSASQGEPATAQQALNGQATEAVQQKPTAPKTNERVHYDLLANADQAHLYNGDALIMDFGTPGSAKYTLGGWRTQVGQAHTLDGRTVEFVQGRKGHILFYAAKAEPTDLHFSVAAFAKPRFKVRLNGKDLGHVDLPGTGKFHTVALKGAPLAAGHNKLSLWPIGGRNVPDIGRVGLAVDWIGVGGSAGENPHRSFPLEVPKGAAVDVNADTKVSLTLASGKNVTPTSSKTNEGTRYDIASYAGQIVRVNVGAAAENAKIMVPAPPPAETTQVENVLVYLIDTLRADKLRPYNPKSRVKTPGLGTFVKKAASFSSAHTQENWTKPSVATLLSSLMPWQHTAVSGDSKVPRSVEMLPETLKTHGFHTASFIANGYVSDKFGFKQGWDSYRNYIREGRRTKAQYVAADVLNWMDKRPKKKPFFLYVHTIDPHVPYRETEFTKDYDPRPYNGPVTFRRSATLLEQIKTGKLKTNARDREQLEALYDGEITYHDVHFTAIINGLKKRGLYDNTLVIITADHGEEFWDHGSVGHGHNVYEELLRIPLFVHWPGVTNRATMHGDSVGLVDIAPTVLTALGLPVPDQYEGRSLDSFIRNGDQSIPSVAVAGFMDNWRTASVGRWKLIHKSEKQHMLFDLQKDPGETNDLSKSAPFTVDYLRSRLGMRLAETERSTRSRRGKTKSGKTKQRHRATKATIDPATQAQLEALGYVGSSKR